MNKTILITGANAGIGKDTARQLALKSETETLYLACRNEAKAIEAKEELEAITGKKIFEIVIMDVSNPESVKQAVNDLPAPVDALVMNAGGMGGKTPSKINRYGVTQMFATNVLGHVVLLDELIKANKLKKVAMYAGSEAARGIKKMNIKRPKLKTASVEEFKSVFDGSFFGSKMDPMEAYSYTKYIATLWMSAAAREHPYIKFITMSPGGTRGTNVMDDMPLGMRLFYKYFAMPIMMPLMGMAHKLEKGAARYVKAISDSTLTSGAFYGSRPHVLTGPIMDQSKIFPDLANKTYQENAYKAVHMVLQ